MTLSDLTSKTPEELNVMCAELCGWKHREATSSHPVERNGMKLPNYFGDDCEAWWHEEREGVFSRPPNYTGSWDAIMPEVRKLKFSDKLRYRTHLQAVVSAKFPELGGRILTIDACTTEAEAIDMTRALILTLHPLTSQHQPNETPPPARTPHHPTKPGRTDHHRDFLRAILLLDAGDDCAGRRGALQ